MLNTALIVDDESLVRSFVSHVLSILNFEVMEAESEEKGWDLFLQNEGKITYVFADLHLLRGSGFQLYRRIRNRTNAVIFVLSSGLPDIEVQDIQDDPHGFFLSKPFSVDALIETAKDVVGCPSPVFHRESCESVA